MWELQIVRTVPEKLYHFAPQARHLVYLENQFLWSIVGILAGKLRQPPSDEFRVVVMLPGRPNIGEDDTQGSLRS